MKRVVELPLVDPIFSTYHKYGSGAAIIAANPSIRNWYLNESINLTCNRSFLSGYTTPRIDILVSTWDENPYFEKVGCATQYSKGYTNTIIKRMLDDGFYICFGGVDDYYVEGKSFYKQRHFNHDGMICGYNEEDKTFTLYAYDDKWVYRKFVTPQKSFSAGRNALCKQGIYGGLCGLRPVSKQVVLEPMTICKNLKAYLDSSLEKYPITDTTPVYGIVVQDYIAMYINELYNERIPYERMDYRVFRLIWEHKRAMLERIQKVEDALKFDHTISLAYKDLVDEADKMRILYASHHMKRRDSLLPIIHITLLDVRAKEQRLLETFVEKMEGVGEV